MGTTALVAPDLQEGQKILDAAKLARLSIRAAAWAHFNEAQSWRLVLVTPLVDRDGPLSVYRVLQKALTKHAIGIPLSQITVAAPRAALARLILQSSGDVSSFASGPATPDVTVDARYVYRLTS